MFYHPLLLLVQHNNNTLGNTTTHRMKYCRSSNALVVREFQVVVLSFLLLPIISSSFSTFIPQQHYTKKCTITTITTQLHSLKPASAPLLDSGKALARSGELLIDYTSTSNYKLYGGGLSSTGASIRNAGDCLAQAAASTRFKTGIELVCDELREAATCLLEASNEKLIKGVNDALVDENINLSKSIEALIPFMDRAGVQLELAGEKIMKKDGVMNIGQCFIESSEGLHSLALSIQSLASIDDGETKENEESIKNIKECSNRMLYAAEKMKEAGNNLKGVEPKMKMGKSWLKG